MFTNQQAGNGLSSKRLSSFAAGLGPTRLFTAVLLSVWKLVLNPCTTSGRWERCVVLKRLNEWLISYGVRARAFRFLSQYQQLSVYRSLANEKFCAFAVWKSSTRDGHMKQLDDLTYGLEAGWCPGPSDRQRGQTAGLLQLAGGSHRIARTVLAVTSVSSRVRHLSVPSSMFSYATRTRVVSEPDSI